MRQRRRKAWPWLRVTVKGREGSETVTSIRDKGDSQQIEAETTLEILYQSPTFMNQKIGSH